MQTTTFFEKIRLGKRGRLISAFLLVNILAELLMPNVALALTAGPSAPEFSSFEPVATTDMVNDFTGDFTYNIPVLNVPGPDGGDYAMSLSYHSGSSSEEEASWVGFGWTLNPGAINRNKRGYADEFNDVNVKTFNKTRPTWSQNAGLNLNIEKASRDGTQDKNVEGKTEKAMEKMLKRFISVKPEEDKSDPLFGKLSLSHAVNYSNYSGFSVSNRLDYNSKIIGSLSVASAGGNFKGMNYKPGSWLNALIDKKIQSCTNSKLKNMLSGTKNWIDRVKGSLIGGTVIRNVKANAMANSPITTYEVAAPPYSIARYLSTSIKYNTSLAKDPLPVAFGFQFGADGNFSIQANIGEENMRAFGYMFSNQANTNTSNDVMYDYSLEKESTFTKHDENLGIPYNNSDVFSMSGSNALGGFRLYQDKIGVYYPNYHVNNTRLRNLGLELAFGANVQLGLNLGAGISSTKVSGKWAYEDLLYGANPKMRLMNDMGGEVDYMPKAEYDIEPKSGIVNINQFVPAVTSILSASNSANYGYQLDASKSSKSSAVDYIMGLPANNSASSKPTITGMVVTDKKGDKSHYTLPVYTRNEAQLSVGIGANRDGSYLVTQALDYNDPIKNTTVMGNIVNEEYANTFLIEKQTTFNYIDVNGNNKADEQDLGGWTSFDYQRAYGENGTWYRYRNPYNGLRYDAGRLVDLKDQTGSMSSGEKEVYYLKGIQSKTHAAFFVTNTMSAATFTAQFKQQDYPYLYNSQTNLPLPSVTLALQGSGTERYDGLDAATIDGNGYDAAASSLTAKGVNRLQRLEKIVLFAKSDVSKPLTTTFFEYDYSLCQGIPNSSNNAPVGQRGKLTLKRVWTEANGLVRSQIAPYIFSYEYFNNYSPELLSNPNYSAMLTGYNAYPTNDANQNPIYKPEHLDAWGFYQLNGAQRIAAMQPWVSQRLAPAHFDPAAWQLKRIQLPSGGEIHVHYEQKDYYHVQDKDAMAMVSLLPDDLDNGYQSDESVYTINLADLGITSPQEVSIYFSKLSEYFIALKNKLYFKMLYALKGDDTPLLNVGKDRYEYVNGYTTVNKITIEGGGTRLALHLGDLRKNGVLSSIAGSGRKDKTLPREVCYQELVNNGGKNLDNGGRFDADRDFTKDVYGFPASTASAAKMEAAVWTNAFNNVSSLFSDGFMLKVYNPLRKNVCKSLSFNLSYFKVPVHFAKKGGGVRVKRLLTYDKGIETGDAMLFGTEYCYETKNGRSSGVASNEPNEMREENALVTFLERKKQKFMDKVKAGLDLKQSEGPLGENVLPSASVVYSRVVVKNIHSGKTTTGFVVNEYNTCKDFPMEVEFSKIKRKIGGGGTIGFFKFGFATDGFKVNINHTSITQAYLFKLNDMHGKPMSKATFAGNYNSQNFDESAFSSKTIYNYSELGKKIKTLVFDGVNDVFKMEVLSPGTEEDYTIYSSVVKERLFNVNFEADINITIVKFSITFAPTITYSDQILRQYVVSKVLRQSSYLLGVTNITDGVVQTTQNLAFDRYTGEPVLTQTFDGYGSENNGIYTEAGGSTKHKGTYYSLNLPAYWMYPSMGPVSQSSLNTNQLVGNAGSVVTYSTNGLADYVGSNTTTAVWSPTMVAYPLNNVVSASAVTYTNNWFTASDAVDLQAPGLATATVLAAANRFYYPMRSFSYRDKVKDANGLMGKIYQGGLTFNAFSFFDWKGYHLSATNTVSPQWYSDSKVTRYSPYGYPVEEQDVLGIKSAAKFGYNNTLPVLVAQNAAYNETQFTDFEYGTFANVTSVAAHTGRYSFDYTANSNYAFAAAYPVTGAIMMQRGLGVKFWLRSILSSQPNSANYNLKNAAALVKVNIGGQLFAATAIAQTGEWTLYSAEVKNFGNLTPGNYPIKINYGPVQGGEAVFIDDFRVQPLDASMNCSVYYADKKLAAQFDDQHFAVVYEYNQKGQLTRKSIETTRGLKMLQEQQYNTPLINR